MLTTPPTWCFTSQFIFAGRDPKSLTAAATVENSTVCLHDPMSTFNSMVGLQLLNTMVGTQLLNIMVGTQQSFSKSSKFSAHLFWVWRHPHSIPISCLGFIMTMVIVISSSLFYAVFVSLNRCVNALFNADKSPSSLFDTYSLSMSSFVCKALWSWVFLFFGPFVQGLLWSTSRMVPSILRWELPR